jgi:hypothetical protein
VRRLLGWTVLACGILIAAWPILAVGYFVVFMQRFGGVPWSRDFIQGSLPIIARLCGIFAVGIVLAVTGFFLRRGRQAS